VTDTIVRADVSKADKMQFLGKINKNATNPIVEVNLVDNKTPEETEKPRELDSFIIKVGHISRASLSNHSGICGFTAVAKRVSQECQIVKNLWWY